MRGVRMYHCAAARPLTGRVALLLATQDLNLKHPGLQPGCDAGRWTASDAPPAVGAGGASKEEACGEACSSSEVTAETVGTGSLLVLPALGSAVVADPLKDLVIFVRGLSVVVVGLAADGLVFFRHTSRPFFFGLARDTPSLSRFGSACVAHQ